MYSTCLYCHQPLGANEVLETFPVGRRLAFDQAKGRLWVVCRRCERWNLSPLEERWEAIEDAERRFRDARKRVSSDNIGLARLNEGLELVRIGEPLRPEFAAWRYGDQFGRRRRRNLIVGGTVGGVGVGLMLAADVTGILSGASYGIWQGYQGIVELVKSRRLVARVPVPEGDRLVVRGRHLGKSRLKVAEDDSEEVRLILAHEKGEAILIGREARRAAALIMPRVNASGGKEQQVRDAVSRLERAGDPVAFLQQAAQTAGHEWKKGKRQKKDPAALPNLSAPIRLAVEMAVNEENERYALEGELALLELEWKEAEEIAAIADKLLVPEEVERKLRELKGE